jgi:hypothetical protein
MNALEPGRQLRDLTGFEEDWLAREGASRTIPAACHELLARCLEPKGSTGPEQLERVRQLSIAERDGLLLQLRKRSFGPQVRSEIRCPKCGATSAMEFPLPDISTASAAIADGLEVRLPSGRLAVLRALTAGDHEEFARAAHLDGVGQARMAMARAVKSVEGISAGEIRDQLTDSDFAALEEAMKAVSPEEIRFELQCHECRQTLRAPFNVCGFFLPN